MSVGVTHCDFNHKLRTLVSLLFFWEIFRQKFSDLRSLRCLVDGKVFFLYVFTSPVDWAMYRDLGSRTKEVKHYLGDKRETPYSYLVLVVMEIPYFSSWFFY